MNLVVALVTVLAIHPAYASEYKLMNVGFAAPSVNGTANVGAPEQGAIILDISTSPYTFTGYTGSAWVPFSAGTSVPAGTVLPYVGTSAPTGYLMCDGSSQERDTFPDLAAALGCTGSTCAFGAADSTHFNLPDFRGRFMRGVDGSAGNDPDKASRTAMASGGNTDNNVGSVQGDAIQGHYHQVQLYSSNNLGVDAVAKGNFASTGSKTSGIDGASTITSDGTNGTPRVTSESRPKNVYMNYIIKL